MSSLNPPPPAFDPASLFLLFVLVLLIAGGLIVAGGLMAWRARRASEGEGVSGSGDARTGRRPEHLAVSSPTLRRTRGPHEEPPGHEPG